jgi:hypothetical protein
MSAKTAAWISSALLALTLLAAGAGFAVLIAQQRRATMIQRNFVGLTRLQPNREQLGARQRDSVDGSMRRLAAYRERHPDDFSSRETWWLDRLDGWVAALPAQ